MKHTQHITTRVQTARNKPLLSLAMIAGLVCRSFAADGPGLVQTSFSEAEVGTEIFRFPSKEVGPQPTMIDYQRGYLYIGAAMSKNETVPGAVTWWDISNPRTPTLLKSVPATGNKPHTATFWDDRMLDGFQGNTFRIWDFDNQKVAGSATGTNSPVWYMGQIPYVYRPRNGYGADANSLDVMKITNTSGKLLSTLDLATAPLPFAVGALHAIGNLLVCSASQGKGVATFDISDPAHPKLLGRLISGNSVYTSLVHGTRVYQCEPGKGIRVYDFSNPARIEEIGLISLPELTPRYVGFKDGKGYCVPGSYKLIRFDTQTLTVDQVWPLAGASDFVQLIGNMAFLGGSGAHNRCSIVPIQAAPDRSGPTVGFASPYDGEQDVAATGRIGFIMSEPISVASLNSDTIIVRPIGGSAISGVCSTQMGMVNFSPDQPLQPSTTYEVILPAGGIQDSVGNAISTVYQSTFRTGGTSDEQTLAHWRMNNSSADSSGGGHDLRLVNGASFTTDRKDGSHALSFNGTGSYADTASLNLGVHFSIAAWVKIPAGTNKTQTLVANSKAGANADGFRLFVNTNDTGDGIICLETGDGTAGTSAKSTPNAFQFDQWNHIVVTVDRSNGLARIYCNGIDATVSTAITPNFSTTQPISLGATFSGGCPLNGALDDVCIYSSELTGTQIQRLSLGTLLIRWPLDGTPEDTSTNAKTLSLFGNSVYGTDHAEGTRSLTLDGLTGYAISPEVNLGNQFTVSAWVKISAASTGIQTVIANSAAGSTSGFGFYINSRLTGDLSLNLETGDGIRSVKCASAAGVFAPNEWRHVAAVVDRGTGSARIYYNGTLVATGAAQTSMANNHAVALGAFGDGSFKLKGGLDDVRIYNRALSNSEVAVLADRSNLAPTALLLTVDNASPKIGQALTFKASATDSNPADSLVYSFDFGDGESTSYSRIPTTAHTYNKPGRYTVIVRVSDGVSTTNRQTTTIVTYSPTLLPATRSAQILYDSVRNMVWTVNPDTDTITRLNGITLAKEAEIQVGKTPRSLALKPDGSALWVVCEDSSEIWSIDPVTGGTLGVKKLGYKYAPVAVSFAPNGSAGFVAASGAERLLKIDPATMAVTARLDLGAAPSGLSISGDSTRVLVSRFISLDTQGEVWEVDPATMRLHRTLALAFDESPDSDSSSRGVPNYLMGATISPDGRSAWVPSKKDNIARGLFRDGQALTHDTTVRSILSFLDLTANTEVLSRRIDVDNQSIPGALCFSPRGDLAFVAYQANNEVLVFDSATGNSLGGVTTGFAPTDLCVSPDGSRLYVQNFLSRSVGVYDITGLTNATNSTFISRAQVSVVANETLPANVLAGKQIFWNAGDPRMSSEGYISCTVCHLHGGHDGRVWDFTDRGEGLRNTIDLRGRSGTGHGRIHWSANFDEIQDFEQDIRGSFGGSGFIAEGAFRTGTRAQGLGDPKAGLSPELDALASYVSSLDTEPASPYRTGGKSTAAGIRGRVVFMGLNCQACHSGESFTDSAQEILHDIGTLKPSSGKRINGPLVGIDTPTLRGLWDGAPYLHDGSAETLADLFSTTNAPIGTAHAGYRDLTNAQQDDLLRFLLEIDASEPAAPVAGIGGVVTREWWTALSGSSVSSLRAAPAYPNSPTGRDQLVSLEAVSWDNQTLRSGWAEQYGERVRGYLTAPVSGNYTFWISGDDNCELLLGTSTTPASAVLLAQISDYSNFRQWNKFPSQKSKVVTLVAGQSYYLEVLHKQASGPNHVSIGWLKPGQTGASPSEIVPGAFLSPF